MVEASSGCWRLDEGLAGVVVQDPGNLEGDLQMGATTGYKLLWLLALASVLVGWRNAQHMLDTSLVCIG